MPIMELFTLPQDVARTFWSLERNKWCPHILYGLPSSKLNPPCPVLFVENIRENLREGYNIARDVSSRAAEYQKRKYDVRSKNRLYSVGDWVAKFNDPGAKLKMAPWWEGPFTVKGRIGEHTVVIENTKGKQMKVHIDRLKPWLSASSPGENLELTQKGSRLRNIPRVDYSE